MATVAELEVKVSADTAPLTTGLTNANRTITGALSNLGDSFKNLSSISLSSLSGIATSMTGLSPLALTALGGVASAVGMVGKAAFDAAVEFDTAFDKIRVSTGATGEQLKVLEGSFRTLFTTLPTTSEAASQALSFLSVRLGLTGKDLELLAAQELELARMTGASLLPQLEATTKAFNRWGIATGEQSKALDFLFKVSQQTAVSVTDLASKLLQSAGPLQDLGFSFEQAAILVGKFTAEGLDVGKMTIGLKLALKKMADEGIKDASEGFKALIEKIQGMKNPMEQLSFATKIFGQRVGEDLVQAIRNGKFELDEIKTKVEQSQETIKKAADDTRDYGESWTVVQNKVKEAIEPLGKIVFDGLTAVVVTFQGKDAEIKTEWGNLWKDLTSQTEGGSNTIVSILRNDAMSNAARAAAQGIYDGFKWLGDQLPGFFSTMWANVKTRAAADWAGIKNAIIEPIQAALDWLRGKAAAFEAAFSAITAAARIGLVIKSPPIAAQWIEMIGEAATKSAAEVARSVPTFSDAFRDITSEAARLQEAASAFILDEVIRDMEELVDVFKGAIPPLIQYVDVFEDVEETMRRAAAAARNLIPAEKQLEGVMEAVMDQAVKMAPKLEDIGDAAKDAARATTTAASGFKDAFATISQFAREHLPKTAQLFIDLAGTIISVLSDLGVKLPGILGKVFGQAPSSAGGSATKAGAAIGGKFVEAFGLALQGAQGVLSASGAPNRVSGAISGGLSGAISGAMIGSMFAPGIGTAIGAIVGGIAGIFAGAWRSPLQKAQEAAALQEAKDAIKLSMDRVLKSAQEVIQSSITSFMKALEFFEKLDEFTNVRKEKFRQFFAALKRMMDHFFELAKQFAGQSLTELKGVAETLLPIAQAIGALPLAFTAINNHFGVAQSSIDRFFADFDKIMTAFFARSEVWIDGVSKRAMKVANRLAPAVQLIANFGGALTAIADVKEPGDEVFGIFDRVIDKILQHVVALNLRFEKDVLKAMANFAEKAGSALALWSTGVSTFKEMVDIKMPTEQDFQNVFAGIEAVIKGMTEMADRLDTTALEKASAIANASLSIFASIKAGVEALASLRDFTGILPEVFTAFYDGFNHAVDLLESMATRAMQFESVSKTFEGYIASGAASLSHAFTMLAQIMNAAGSFFPGGTPAVVGGEVPSLATGGDVLSTGLAYLHAGERVVPAAQVSQGGATHVTVNFYGTVLDEAKAENFVYNAVRKAQKQGRLIMAPV